MKQFHERNAVYFGKFTSVMSCDKVVKTEESPVLLGGPHTVTHARQIIHLFAAAIDTNMTIHRTGSTFIRGIRRNRILLFAPTDL